VPLYENAWHVLGAALVFMLGAGLCAALAPRFEATRRRALFLYAWHTVFCFVYLAYVMRDGGDALGYFRNSLVPGVEFDLGTAAINVLASVFSSWLGLSILGTFLAFNVFGCIGLIAYDAALRTSVDGKDPRLQLLALVIVLLPSVSFWSAGIGKDAISFMSAGLALYAAIALRSRALLMAIAILAMLLVRPHMAALMVTALAASMLRRQDVSLVQRVVLGAGAVVGCFALVPLAMQTSGLGTDAGLFDLGEYIETRQQQNLTGGGAVDISRMTLPGKLFTYLLRPMPFEAHNLPSFAASLDNMVLALLVIGGLAGMLGRNPVSTPGNRSFLWLYALSAWVLLALTTANLGISMRQKWMFVPMLLFLLLSAMGRRRQVAGATSPAEGYRHG
jgi:hypothetical protein